MLGFVVVEFTRNKHGLVMRSFGWSVELCFRMPTSFHNHIATSAGTCKGDMTEITFAFVWRKKASKRVWTPLMKAAMRLARWRQRVPRGWRW